MNLWQNLIREMKTRTVNVMVLIFVSFFGSFPLECDFCSLCRRLGVMKLLLYEEIFQVSKETTTENQMEEIS